jgi:hypothetical protein
VLGEQKDEMLDLSRIESRYFKPWVGSLYEQNGINGKNVLILGESIYRCNKTSKDRCVELIENNCSGDETHKFYTNIYLAFMGPGSPRHVSEKRLFWDKVCFINFVDDVVEKGSRQPPERNSIEKARRDWQNVLLALQPNIVIALGKRLWGYLPSSNCEYSFSVDNDNCLHPVKEYNIEDRIVKATYIYHPSSGFSSYAWNPVLKKFLDQ